MTIETYEGTLINYDHVAFVTKSGSKYWNVLAVLPGGGEITIANYGMEVNANGALQEIRKAIATSKKVISFNVDKGSLCKASLQK